MERSEMDYDIYVGMDVGKFEDYVVALARDGDERLIDSPVSQDEGDIRAMLAVAMSYGKPLLVVDVWGGFGTLPVLVAAKMGVDVAHMPSRAFSKAAESYGEDKYDAKDAFVLADATRWRPQLVYRVGAASAAVEEVKLLTAARWDAVQERTRLYNRVHDLLQRLCPAKLCRGGFCRTGSVPVPAETNKMPEGLFPSGIEYPFIISHKVFLIILIFVLLYTNGCFF